MQGVRELFDRIKRMSALEAFVVGVIICVSSFFVAKKLEDAENLMALVREFVRLFGWIGACFIVYSLKPRRLHEWSAEDELTQSGAPWGNILLGLAACAYVIANLFVRNISIMGDKVSVADCISAELGFAIIKVNDVDFYNTRFGRFSMLIAGFALITAVLIIKSIRLLLMLRRPDIKRTLAMRRYCFYMKLVFAFLFILNSVPFVIVREFYYDHFNNGETLFDEEFKAGNYSVIAVILVGLLSVFLCERMFSHKKE